MLIANVTHAEKPKKNTGPEERIIELELKEFHESSNLEVKEELASAYWCNGKKGLAVEKWLWLNQFFRNHPRRPIWKKLIQLANYKTDKLADELKCIK